MGYVICVTQPATTAQHTKIQQTNEQKSSNLKHINLIEKTEVKILEKRKFGNEKNEVI